MHPSIVRAPNDDSTIRGKLHMNLDAVVARIFPRIEQTYTARDTILYALGVGAGCRPECPAEMAYVDRSRLRIVPAQATVLAFPGPWLRDPALEVDYAGVLHAGQHLEMVHPLRVEATVRGEFQLLGIEDKGVGKGAVVHLEKRLIDTGHNGIVCKVRSTFFLRGDGGCGSWGEPAVTPLPLPDRRPDRVVEVGISKRQALIYQLSGDYNPLHVDPQVASRAGFERPILHGLSTFGSACLAVVLAFCGGEPDRLLEFDARFSRPVYPGDKLALEFFDVEGTGRFRAKSLKKDEVVLDRGTFRVRS